MLSVISSSSALENLHIIRFPNIAGFLHVLLVWGVKLTDLLNKIGLIVRSRHFQPFLISEHRPFFTTAISIIIGFFDFFSKHTLLSITFCFPLTLRQI